jgi:hypothetical protein
MKTSSWYDEVGNEARENQESREQKIREEYKMKENVEV